jgi:hypothetical protein
MKTVEDGERFNQFVALHEKAVWDEVLKSVRVGMGDPNWSPNSITGMTTPEEALVVRFSAISSYGSRRCLNTSESLIR